MSTLPLIFWQKLEKVTLKNRRRWRKKSFFFQRQCFPWRRCYGHELAVLKNVPKKFCTKSPYGICLNSENDFLEIVQKMYFDPICLFGYIKWQIDKTDRISHRESEATYVEVRRVLRPYRFSQNYISLKLFPGTKSTFLTTLLNSCRQKSERFSLKSENGRRIEKRYSHQMSFLRMLFWQMEFSFENPANEIRPEMKIIESKYKEYKGKLPNCNQNYFP